MGEAKTKAVTEVHAPRIAGRILALIEAFREFFINKSHTIPLTPPSQSSRCCPFFTVFNKDIQSPIQFSAIFSLCNPFFADIVVHDFENGECS
ncbi:hypothetical protein [Bacillus paralicheniformis]|uniref:hypothetical protein n=1 Tax=Bacillus paralicheniformis TaxID=1648923 RepID=UPI0018F87F9B|nr:hypothetical protein [Bacillus paralicheniformis]